MRRNGSVLVIDDEEIMREILQTLLEREGYGVRIAASGQEGLDLARALPFDAVIVDVMMPGIDGLQVLEELKKQDDNLPVLMITAFASMDTAIKAMKLGAFDYITKPFKNDEVLVVLRNALAQRRLVAENRALRQNLQAHANRFGEITEPLLRIDGAGECALHVPEQGGLEEIRRQIAGVDRDERLFGARRVHVQRAGDQLLAGTALALDQHGRAVLGDLADQAQHLLDRLALTEQLR